MRRRRQYSELAAVLCLTFLTFCPTGTNTPAHAAESGCPLALVLAVDVSGSVDHQNYRLQMQGYAAAFRDPDVLQAIGALGPGGLTVTLMQWSSVAEQAQTVGWSRVSGPASAAVFAAAVEKAPRKFNTTGTAIGSALSFAVGLIQARPTRCKRSVIDVSGDGQSNVGPEPAPLRDLAVSAGMTVNGLAIMNSDNTLDVYYSKHIIGGPGAFVMTTGNYMDIATTIRKKLLRELSPHLSNRPPGSDRPHFAKSGP